MERADRKNGGPDAAAWPETEESPGAALQRTLADRYRAPLMAFFHRRTGDGVEAEDLAQEVLARVLRRGDLDRVEKPDAFIFMTARNLLRDRARRAEVRVRSQGDLEVLEAGGAGVSPERVIQGRQDLRQVMAVLDALDGKTRDMFILHRLEGMTYRQIAGLYGVSISAVEKRLIKAFARLMDCVDDR